MAGPLALWPPAAWRFSLQGARERGSRRWSTPRPDSGLFVGHATAHLGEIVLLHLGRVELRRAVTHLREDLLRGRDFALDPPERIDARDDERPEVRAYEAL